MVIHGEQRFVYYQSPVGYTRLVLIDNILTDAHEYSDLLLPLILTNVTGLSTVELEAIPKPGSQSP